MSCLNCNTQCLDNVMDGCVEWTGPSIPCCDIKNGEYYDTAIVKLATTLCDHIEASKANLGCLYDNCGDVVVDLPVAVSKIIDKICSLNTDDIANTASLGCLSTAGNSIYSSTIPNKNMTYSTVGLKDGVQVVYNMNGIISDLPADYSMSSAKVTVTGQSYAAGGRTVLSQSDKSAGGFTLTPDKFPVNLKAEMDVNTPDGTVRLTKYLSVSGESSNGEKSLLMEVDDLTGNVISGLTQTDVNKTLSSAVCQTKFGLDSLKEVQVTGCDNMSHPSNHLHSIIQVHDGKICELLSRMDNLGAESIASLSCDGCTTTTSIGSLQSALSAMSAALCQMQSDLSSLQAQVSSQGNCNG